MSKLTRSQYKDIKAGLKVAKKSEFYHQGTAYKVLASSNGVSVSTVKKVDNNPTFKAMYPKRAVRFVTTDTYSMSEVAYEPNLELRVASLEERITNLEMMTQ